MITVIPCPSAPGSPAVFIVDTDNFPSLVTWLRTKDLPADLILDFKGTMYRFRSLAERLRWAEGLEVGIDIMHGHPMEKDDD